MNSVILVVLSFALAFLFLKLGGVGRDHLIPPSDTGLDSTDKPNSAYGLAAAGAHYWLERARITAKQRLLLVTFGIVIGGALFKLGTEFSP